jgi:hypothetical protein
VSLVFSGGINKAISGTVASGVLGVTISKNGDIEAISGKLTVVAMDGSSATVKVAIAGSGGWYAGDVEVQDPADGISTTAVVLT